MPVLGYKAQCEARKRGTFYFSDFKFPCKKEEIILEEDFESLKYSEEDLATSEYDGEDYFDVDGVSVEKEQLKEKRQKKIKKKKKKEKFVSTSLDNEKPPSCYLLRHHDYDDNFIARWKEKEKENFGRTAKPCPKIQDSYEEMIKQPLIAPRPLPTPSPPASATFLNPCTSFYPYLNSNFHSTSPPGKLGRMRAHLQGIFTREEIPTIPCLFCNGTLYENGLVHDLHDKVQNIVQESLLKNDEIARKIGNKTRITVHKLCYEEYIKRPLNGPLEEKSTIYS